MCYFSLLVELGIELETYRSPAKWPTTSPHHTSHARKGFVVVIFIRSKEFKEIKWQKVLPDRDQGFEQGVLTSLDQDSSTTPFRS